MHIEAYTRIIITSPEIVEFLSENQDQKEIQTACERVLLEFIKTTRELMKQHASNEDHRRRESSLLSMIQSIEQRQQEYSRQLEHNLKSSLTSTITESLSGVLQTTNSILSLTFENFANRFNADTIAASITETLKGWLDGHMSANASSIQLTLSTIQNQLRDDLQRLATPLTSAQDRMIDELRQLPSKIDSNINLDAEIQRLTTTLSTYHDQMHHMRSGIKDIESVVKIAMTKMTESKDLSVSQQKAITHAISNVPLMTKGLLCELIRSLEDKNTTICMTLSEAKGQLRILQENIQDNGEVMSQLNAHTQSLSHKVDEVDKRMLARHVKQDNSNQMKGAGGEGKMIDMLSDKLLVRDGYKIHHVSGVAHSCDILVQKMNQPDVRIEVKAHADKVRYKEVEKFKNDLHMLDNHGIFVSLHSGIVGVSDFEIEQQPTGKFAVYLSNNNFDIDVVVAMVLLLYRMDVLSKKEEDNEKNIRVSHETLTFIKEQMKEHMAKLQVVKSHLKESITILGNIQLDTIEKLLLAPQKAMESKKPTQNTWACKWCTKSYAKFTSLRSHEGICPHMP